MNECVPLDERAVALAWVPASSPVGFDGTRCHTPNPGSPGDDDDEDEDDDGGSSGGNIDPDDDEGDFDDEDDDDEDDTLWAGSVAREMFRVRS